MPARRRSVRLRTALVATAVLVPASVLAGAPPAMATRGHAPKTPTGLTVDDRLRPLNVEGTPRFGWLPRDSDPGETQTAYRLTVSAVHGDLVWDSGKVRSGQQSYVPYGGSALAAGTAYRWTVRTWDQSAVQDVQGQAKQSKESVQSKTGS